jgi:hypothetical protein
METKFIQIKIGGRFTFYGQTFTKTTPNTAEDGEQITHIFDDAILVEEVPEPDRRTPVARLIQVMRVRGNWKGERRR